MSRSRRFAQPLQSLTLGVALAFVWLDAGPAWTAVATVLGQNGTVVSLRQEAANEASFLVLDVQRPDAPAERLTVPGTENPSIEGSPSLVYQERSDTYFLLWQGWLNSIHPVLHLASYHDGAFSAVTQLLAGPWSAKSAPQLLATHESYAEGGVEHEITVLHIVWAEQQSLAHETFYAPIVLVDGQYIGRHDLYRLSDFDTSPPVTNVEFDLAPALQQTPRLSPGRDGRSVSILYAVAATKRIVTLEIDVLPRALTRLADEARGHIIIWGVSNPKRATLAEMTAAWIRANGTELLPEIAESIANGVRGLITSDAGGGATDLERLADEARGHIIVWGSRGRGRGLAEAAEGLSVAFADAGPTSIEGERAPASLRFGVATSRPGFRVGSGEVRTFVSSDASRAAVAWFDTAAPTVVRYRLSASAGSWSDPQELALDQALNLERALEILQQRINKR